MLDTPDDRQAIIADGPNPILYHRVFEHENSIDAMADIWSVFETGFEHYDDPTPNFILEIDGHRNDAGGLETEMMQLLTVFVVPIGMGLCNTLALGPLGRGIECSDKSLEGSLKMHSKITDVDIAHVSDAEEFVTEHRPIGQCDGGAFAYTIVGRDTYNTRVKHGSLTEDELFEAVTP